MPYNSIFTFYGFSLSASAQAATGRSNSATFSVHAKLGPAETRASVKPDRTNSGIGKAMQDLYPILRDSVNYFGAGSPPRLDNSLRRTVRLDWTHVTHSTRVIGQPEQSEKRC